MLAHTVSLRRPLRGPAKALAGASLLCALAACYDDTPMRLRIIDGETDRPLYARTIRRAADAVRRGGGTPDRRTVEAIEMAYQQSQAAYGTILDCEDEGTCRRRSLRHLCADVTALLDDRRVLAPHSDLFAISEQLSADRGPLTFDRVQALRQRAAQDGSLSELEENVLTLATAAAAAHRVYALTPSGQRDAARYRQSHAIEEFAVRCEVR